MDWRGGRRRRADAAPSGACCDLRGRVSGRGSEDGDRWPSDYSGLGAGVQCRGGLLTGQAPGQTPLLSDEHRRALAAIIDQGPTPAVEGLGRLAVRALRGIGERADYELGNAGSGLPQAFRPTAPSCAGAWRH